MKAADAFDSDDLPFADAGGSFCDGIIRGDLLPVRVKQLQAWAACRAGVGLRMEAA